MMASQDGAAPVDGGVVKPIWLIELSATAVHVQHQTKDKTRVSTHTIHAHTRHTHHAPSIDVYNLRANARPAAKRPRAMRVLGFVPSRACPIATSRRRRHRHHPPPITARARAHKNIPPTRTGARRATACFPPKTARAFARTDGAIVIDHALMFTSRVCVVSFRLPTTHVDERRNNGYIVNAIYPRSRRCVRVCARRGRACV